MHRRILMGVIAVATALVGCGLPVQETARPIPAEQIPDALLPEGTTTSTTTPSDEQQPATVYLVNEDNKLASRTRQLDTPTGADTMTVLTDLVRAVVTGPDQNEQEQLGLTSFVPDGTELASPPTIGGLEGFDEDTVALDLNEAFYEPLEGTRASLAAAQLVFTLTSQATVQSVTFLLDGVPQSIRTSEGDVPEVPREMTRADFAGFDPLVARPTEDG